MILEETVRLLRDLCGDHWIGLRIEKIVLGIFFSGVKLTDGSGGVAYTPKDELHDAHCCPAMAAERPALRGLKGNLVEEVLAHRRDSTLGNLVGLLVLNALSSRFLSLDRYDIVYDKDALDLIDIPRAGRIGMVGAFIPFLKTFKSYPSIDLTVLEQKQDTLRADEMRFYAPAEKAVEVLPVCDTVIITGASIANGTIDGLLSWTRPGANVIVTGPTASLLPDALFARNVSMVSGVEVTDPDLAIDMLSEGVGAYHLFNACVRKINIIKT